LVWNSASFFEAAVRESEFDKVDRVLRANRKRLVS
jgi:hypothetical protein